MALRIKSYPNMDTISNYDDAEELDPFLEEIAKHNGIGLEISGCVIGQNETMQEQQQRIARETAQAHA